jgi:hypothetical protein
MTNKEMLQILEGLTDEELGQHLSDLVYEVVKLTNQKEWTTLYNIKDELEMAHNEWEYRNQ